MSTAHTPVTHTHTHIYTHLSYLALPLRFHAGSHGMENEVFDISWSPSAHAVISGTKNGVCLWDVRRPSSPAAEFADHSQMVQGVAFDPRGQWFTTVSNDRSSRVYYTGSPAAAVPTYERCYYIKRRLYAAAEPGNEASKEDSGKKRKQKRHGMYADESMPSFFRRPAWTPDGSLLVVPAGQYQASVEAPVQQTTWAFARSRLDTPVAHWLTGGRYSTCARACPILFKLPPTTTTDQTQLLTLPYRMVVAVASLDTVTLYDTVSSVPLAFIGNIHMDCITDVAWSPDGRTLWVASRDGYVTCVVFEDGELGERLEASEWPEGVVAHGEARLFPFEDAVGVASHRQKTTGGHSEVDTQSVESGVEEGTSVGADGESGDVVASPLTIPPASAHVAPESHAVGTPVTTKHEQSHQVNAQATRDVDGQPPLKKKPRRVQLSFVKAL
jgi:chromatin assembly factor 1 subunit B